MNLLILLKRINFIGKKIFEDQISQFIQEKMIHHYQMKYVENILIHGLI